MECSTAIYSFGGGEDKHFHSEGLITTKTI